MDDDPDISENEHQAITCPACTRIHLVNRKTGKLLAQDDRPIAAFSASIFLAHTVEAYLAQ